MNESAEIQVLAADQETGVGLWSPAAAARLLEAAALIVILAAGAYLRLANNMVNPGWYSDEGTVIDIARHMLAGRTQYLAVNQSTLLFARVPLFPWLLSGLFRVFGVSIGVLRTFTGFLGVVSILLLYCGVKRMTPQKSGTYALLAALMLAIYPQAIVHNRLGFSYNLITPLILITFFGLWEYLRSRSMGWLAVASLAVGVGGLSDLVMLNLILPLIVVTSARNFKHLLISLGISLLPFAVYTTVMMAAVPEAFLFDMRFTISRLTEVPLVAQLPILSLNFAVLLTRDLWLAPAIIGLFLLEPRRLKRLAFLMLFLPIFFLGRTVGLASSLSFYYISPLVPVIALGVGVFTFHAAAHVLPFARSAVQDLTDAWGWQGSSPVSQWIRTRFVALASSLVFFIVVIAPFLISAFLSFGNVRTGFQTAFDPVLVDSRNAQSAADYVNAHASADDTVLASPAIGWLLQTQVADFQMALARDGLPTRHLPVDIPADRFVFDPRFPAADLVVIDPIWRNWAAPNMAEIAEWMAEVESWPVAYEAGDIVVYRNPEAP